MLRPWTVVNPSDPLQLDEGLWGVTDDIPGIKGTNRRMTIVRRADGRLIFFNAIPLKDEQLEKVRSFGTPAELFVPNHFHAMDAHAFATKLGLEVFAPAAGLETLRTKGVEARPHAELPPDADLQVHTVDGFKTGEGVLVVRRPKGASLVVADLVTNAPHAPGFGGLLMRLVGFTGPQPTLPPPVRMRVGRDLKKVKALLESLAATPGLSRLVPSHGDVSEHDVPSALRRVAAKL